MAVQPQLGPLVRQQNCCAVIGLLADAVAGWDDAGCCRLRSGFLSRLELERWLRKRSRVLTGMVASSDLLALLDAATAGGAQSCVIKAAVWHSSWHTEQYLRQEDATAGVSYSNVPGAA